MTLSLEDYAFVQKLVRERAAIAIRDDQGYLIRSRLETVARDAGLPDLRALVERLRREPNGALHTQVVEAMTTNETSFFRDIHPFDALAKSVLPELIQKRQSEKTLRIWSAACSTGQEPYSLAMLLTDRFPELRSWQIKILATDLSSAAIDKAQAGRYGTLETGRGLPASMLVRYFDRIGASFEVKPQVRALIEWKQMNLAGRWPLLPPFDLVFIRNVLIYFSPETSAAVLTGMREVLRPGGYLFLGSTEKLPQQFAGFASVTIGRTIAYRRDDSRKR